MRRAKPTRGGVVFRSVAQIMRELREGRWPGRG